MRLEIPRAWYGEALPDGYYAALVTGSHVETSQGAVPLPPSGQNLLYLRVDVPGRFVGQGQADDLAHEYLNGQYHERGPAYGPNACIYDDAHVLHVHPGPTPIGYRYIDANGQIVTAEATYTDPVRGLYEWTDAGGVRIGQGPEDGCHVRFEVDGISRLLEPGEIRNVRVRREGDRFAVAMVRQGQPSACIIHWITLTELRALPEVAEPEFAVPVLPEFSEPKFIEGSNVMNIGGEIRDLAGNIVAYWRDVKEGRRQGRTDAESIAAPSDVATVVYWDEQEIPPADVLARLDPTRHILSWPCYRDANESLTNMAIQHLDVALAARRLGYRCAPVLGFHRRGVPGILTVTQVLECVDPVYWPVVDLSVGALCFGIKDRADGVGGYPELWRGVEALGAASPGVPDLRVTAEPPDPPTPPVPPISQEPDMSSPQEKLALVAWGVIDDGQPFVEAGQATAEAVDCFARNANKLPDDYEVAVFAEARQRGRWFVAGMAGPDPRPWRVCADEWARSRA